MKSLFQILCILLLNSSVIQAQAIFMYPGDTNNDGVANHFDLLPIGLAYGMEGIPRPGATQQWSLQILEPAWPDALPVSGINKGFADSDGNGFIDSLDIDAIALNYDSVQNNAEPPPMPYPPKLTDTCFSCPKPDILITYSADTLIGASSGFDTLYAYVQLIYPPGVPQQFGALGIAFDLEYDYDPDKIIDSLTQVYADTLPDTRMYLIATSTKANLWRLPAPGRMGFAGAGRGNNAFFISDTLFTIKYIITDMIIRGAETFSLKIDNILMINNQEQVVCFGSIKQEPVAILSPAHEAPEAAPLLFLSPNPVKDRLRIETPGLAPGRADIFDAAGRLVISASCAGQNPCYLDVSALRQGVWMARVKTRHGVAVQKFIRD
ncbi:MAG: T9SS type A sorting domain-containing protein [Saprospiraceae bacterium]|nr:T9SS type A sorting domain-containing protein [Saprospiraceae bacterium]